MLKWYKTRKKRPKQNRPVIGYWPRKDRLLVCKYDPSWPQWYMLTFAGLGNVEKITTSPCWWAYIDMPGKKVSKKKINRKKEKNKIIKNRFELIDVE